MKRKKWRKSWTITEFLYFQ